MRSETIDSTTAPAATEGREGRSVCACACEGACVIASAAPDGPRLGANTRERLLRACHRLNDAVASPPERRSTRAFLQRPLVYGAMLGYALLSIGLMMTRQVGLTSEHAILLLLVVFSLFGRARPFVWDWMPFLFVAVMFEDLTSVGAKIAGSVHVIGPIVLEKSLLGGTIATTWLQDHIGEGFFGQLLGDSLAVEYLFHFAAPLVAGLWLWRWHRERFGPFVGAYMLVMCMGFITYLIYPEMPPWLAAEHGDLPQVHRIVVETLQHLGGIGSFYSGADPEPNAAMPSLHVSVPLVISLSIISVKGWGDRRQWLWLLYPLTLSFGVVYLGEHYIADVVVGLALGVACWWVAELGYQHDVRRRISRLAAATMPAVTSVAVAQASAGRRPDRR